MNHLEANKIELMILSIRILTLISKRRKSFVVEIFYLFLHRSPDSPMIEQSPDSDAESPQYIVRLDELHIH